MKRITDRRAVLQYVLLAVGFLILAYVIARSGLVSQLGVLWRVHVPLFVLAFALSVLSIVVKVFRWKYLSRHYGAPVSWRDASLVSVSSLFLANITPGKVGDVFKAYYMKHKFSLNLVDGITMIFYERFFELAILFIVAASVVFIQLRGITVIILEACAILIVLLAVVYYKADWIIRMFQKFFVKIPSLRSRVGEEVSVKKLPPVSIFVVFLVTSLSLVLEFIRLWVVALAFGFLLNPLQVAIFFSLAIIAGLVSQIPMGVGVMEASLQFFFEEMGVDPLSSIAIVIADRMISMYFALAIGFVFSKFALDEIREEAA